MRKCELCKLPATLYCESDQASLCTGCDAKVHEANFLVARHSRTLLCRTCQSPTPWAACGARLGNTTTECDKCIGVDQNEEAEASSAMSASKDRSFCPISLSLSLSPPTASSSSSCNDEPSVSSKRPRPDNSDDLFKMSSSESRRVANCRRFRSQNSGCNLNHEMTSSLP